MEGVSVKKTLCAILALVLVGTAALAGAPKLAPGLFDSAKLALTGLAAGEYEALSEQLPFSGNAPDAAQWQRLAEGYADLTEVQDEYAVAFWTGKVWVVAVPL